MDRHIHVSVAPRAQTAGQRWAGESELIVFHLAMLRAQGGADEGVPFTDTRTITQADGTQRNVTVECATPYAANIIVAGGDGATGYGFDRASETLPSRQLSPDGQPTGEATTYTNNFDGAAALNGLRMTLFLMRDTPSAPPTA
ncbi:MAG TPA: hypothetical protein VLF71_06020 [Candidatus Saccharimonadales bacterium]|nr:hypothetical protein [Candidatus Saccharimonadales bacterium]